MDERTYRITWSRMEFPGFSLSFYVPAGSEDVPIRDEHKYGMKSSLVTSVFLVEMGIRCLCTLSPAATGRLAVILLCFPLLVLLRGAPAGHLLWGHGSRPRKPIFLTRTTEKKDHDVQRETGQGPHFFSFFCQCFTWGRRRHAELSNTVGG